MTELTTHSARSGHSFREWSHSRPLADALARAEAAVRAQPQDAAARRLLFELLCVLAQWDRALKQLQAWAGLEPGADSTAHVLRGLIRAELQRVEVFSGRLEPATIGAGPTPAPGWMNGMGEALRLGRVALDDGLHSDTESADAAREAALSQAPETPGGSNLVPSFGWITDSDTRLGPVCEVMVAGGYRWLPFDDLASLSKDAPSGLLDLVWSQVDLVLRDGSALKAYMPMRYPVTSSDRDAILMARETLWSEVGRTGVHARGQKMWATDAGDLPLLDLRSCSFRWSGAGGGTVADEEQADAAR